jgi:hypothetical protein
MKQVVLTWRQGVSLGWEAASVMIEQTTPEAPDWPELLDPQVQILKRRRFRHVADVVAYCLASAVLGFAAGAIIATLQFYAVNQ